MNVSRTFSYRHSCICIPPRFFNIEKRIVRRNLKKKEETSHAESTKTKLFDIESEPGVISMQDWSHQTLLVDLFFAFFFFFFSPCRVYTQNVAKASIIHSEQFAYFPVYIYIHTHTIHTHTQNIRIHIHDTLLSPFDDVHKRVKRVFEESSRQIIQRKRAQARKQHFDNELSYRSLSIVNASQRKKKKEKSDFSDRQRGGKVFGIFAWS